MNAPRLPASWEGLLDWLGIVAAIAFVGLGWLAGDWGMRQADLRMRDEHAGTLRNPESPRHA